MVTDVSDVWDLYKSGKLWVATDGNFLIRLPCLISGVTLYSFLKELWLTSDERNDYVKYKFPVVAVTSGIFYLLDPWDFLSGSHHLVTGVWVPTKYIRNHTLYTEWAEIIK